MENIFQRFPHIGEAILSHLDNENLANCNGINQDWQDFLGQQKLFWIRMIKKYVGSSHNLPDSWLKFLPKTPIDIVKAIALDVKEFYTAEQEKPFPHDGSPLLIAAACGNLKVCKYILTKVDDKNPKTGLGVTPLHVVAYYGYFDVFKIILDNVVDKNPSDKDGRTPLYVAAGRGHLDIVKVLIESVGEKNPPVKSEDTPLHLAAQEGHLEICRAIMDNLDDKNPRNKSGVTPLHFAAHCGHLKLCQLIIANVDDKNPRNNNGITPLIMAAKQGHLEICKLIVHQMEAKEKLWKNLIVGTSMFLAGGLTATFLVYMISK